MANTDHDRRFVWTVFSYRAAATVARTVAPGAAWHLARTAERSAERLLRDEGDAERRQQLETIMIGAVQTAGNAASARGHPLARVLAAGRMSRCSQRLAHGDPAIVAVAIERAVTLLIERGRIDDARRLVDDAPPAVAAAHQAWAVVKARAYEPYKEPWREARTRSELVCEIRTDIMRLLALADEDVRTGAAEFLARFETDADPLQLLALHDFLHAKGIELGDDDPAARHRARMAHHQRAFVDGDHADPAVGIAELEESEGFFLHARAWDDVATIRLSLGHACASLGDSDAAIRWYAAAIEAQAMLATDPSLPVLTAGNAERMRPYYEALVHGLMDAGRYRAALRVAERCKAELWRRLRPDAASGDGDQLDGSNFDPCLTGFISYFVESDGIAILWGDRAGVVHGTRVGIGRAQLEAYVGAVRSNGWRPTGLFTPSNARAIRALAGLLKPLGAFLVAERDLPLTIAPDGILHNVPWHLLQVGRERLIEQHPVRMVLHLDHANFVKRAAEPNPQATLLIAPSLSDDIDAWREWGVGLGILIAQGDSARISAGQSPGLAESIHDRHLHVRCHGHFPEGSDIRAEDAFRSSGLLLGHRAPAVRIAQDQLTTPADLLAAVSRKAQPSGHVVVEACVSGVVHDGAAGDPISLPWVLALSGVRTVIASHWNVDIAHAEAFFRYYYEAKVGRGEPAGVAYRAATIHVLDRFGPAAASFRLLGFDG